MTEADDNHVVDLRDVDRIFEQILAGEVTAPEVPAWYGDLARLVADVQVGPTDGELAAEHDIVQAMAHIRRVSRTTPAGAGDEAHAPHDADPLDDLVARWSTSAPAVALTAVPDVPASSPPAAPAASHSGPSDAGPRLRSVPPDGDGRPFESETQAAAHHSPRHVSGRPRHAAGSPAAPTARALAQVLAAKTAAVTTAVILGTVAAAAATTGIVSKVVVPTLDDRVVKTAMSPWAVGDEDAADEARGSERGRSVPEGVGEDDETVVGTPSCPTLVLVCSPLTPAGQGAPGTGTADAAATTPAKSGTGLVAETTTTTAPATTDPAASATTTTTVDTSPPPTEPPPPTTTTSETTTTTAPPEPGPFSASDSGTLSVP